MAKGQSSTTGQVNLVLAGPVARIGEPVRVIVPGAEIEGQIARIGGRCCCESQSRAARGRLDKAQADANGLTIGPALSRARFTPVVRRHALVPSPPAHSAAASASAISLDARAAPYERVTTIRLH